MTTSGAATPATRGRRRSAVDVRATANLVGLLAKYLGGVVVFPMAVALWYSEPLWPFLAAGAITSGAGYLLERLTAGTCAHVGVREGFLVVSVTLLMTAAFASLPYLFVGGDQLGHPIDAYIEGMSASTTTGASVVTDFDELSKSLSMWRQFTQWLGGMGIIILAVAVLPRLRVGGRQMMESELPGPEVAQLPERIRQTARLLWVLYVGLTVVLALALASLGWLGIDDRMTEFEALAHAFSTIPTGGFSTQPNSIQAFSPAAQWIIALFMLIAGVNFVLLYRGLVRRRPRVFVRDEEFRLYIAIVLAASIALTIQIWGYDIAAGRGGDASRASSRPSPSSRRPGTRPRTSRSWPVALAADDLRADVRRRLGGLDDRLDQGRPAPSRRQDPAPRARPDGEPGGRHARSAERGTGRRAHAARDRGVHPPVHRLLGRRSRGHRRSTPRSATFRSARSTRWPSRRARSGTGAPGSGSPGHSPRSRRSATSPRSR